MNKLLKEWQHRLGLDDWNIVLYEDCTIGEIGNNAGLCDRDDVNKCATIQILREEEYGNRVLPFDKEKVLVHELLHIKFWLLDESESLIQNKVVHQLIDDIARALIDAKRK